MEFRHPVRGFLIGPVVAPIAYSIAMAADAIAHNVPFRPSDAVRELLVILMFGAPVAYGAALALGAPVVFVLHRLGALRFSTMVVAGSLSGVIVALWLAASQEGSLFRVRMPLPLGAALGALAGGACWRAGRGAP